MKKTNIFRTFCNLKISQQSQLLTQSTFDIFSQRSSNVFYLDPIEMFLNSKSFESSEGANKCYNSKFVLWICTSYQLNSSKASTFIVYFSQLCVFNSLVQTMIKTRCAHGHWSPEWTWSLHIVTHGVTKQEDACSHCLTPSNPRGDHTLHGYCGKCSFDKSTAADGRWVKPSNTPEINLWPLRQWSITQQAVGHPRSIRVAIHPSNGVPLRASPQVQMSGCGHFGYAFVQTPGASGKIWHKHEDSEKFSSGKKRFRRM